MSAVSSICLFSAALCNIGNLDDSVFGNTTNQQQVATDQLVNIGTNLFNQGLGGLGLGGFAVNRVPANQQQPLQNPQNPQNQQNQHNKKKPKQPHDSPCPGKFRYVTNNQNWKGVARFPNINPDKETQIHIDFVLPKTVGQNQATGQIELVNDPSELYQQISNSLPVLFETSFASQNPVPKMVAIYKNKKLICGAPVDALRNNQFRSFRLSYDLRPYELQTVKEDTIDDTEDQVLPSSTEPPPTTQPPTTQPPTTKATATTKAASQGNFQSDDSVCGVPVAGFTQSLVIGGQAAGHGEWPWLVAFYRSKSGNLEFICGGSLIASKFVITAAHCVQDKGQESPMQTQNALFFIGKHNLIEWNETGFEKKGAKTLTIHPDWKPFETNYDADITLAELDSAVKYSKFIRPICLWSGSDDLSKVVGQVGIVAGWGKNDNGELNTDFPKKVNVPIASDGTCLRTHEAFVHITSDRTFCAGGRAGEGPCQGDSGGGLVLKIGKKWILRGVVSASLRDGASCDVNSFAVFTDVAKFLPWIKEKMKKPT